MQVVDQFDRSGGAAVQLASAPSDGNTGNAGSQSELEELARRGNWGQVCSRNTVNPGYNEPFCTVANGSLYPGVRCKRRDFTSICQGGAHREGSLYPGILCIRGFVVSRVICIVFYI